MNHVYLLTGGNVGDRKAFLEAARIAIEQQVGTVIKASPIYETAPWGLADQSAFLNQVLQVATSLSPTQLLHTVLGIEEAAGRKRLQKNGPRTIDIDILFYADLVVKFPNLIIPHPEIANRRFVLTPLNDIAPKFIHPVHQKSLRELLQQCPDPLAVSIFQH